MTLDANDYRKMTSELKGLLDDMQNENTDVDEAMKKYEHGQKLIKNLEKYLDEAENKLVETKLSGREKTEL